MSNLSNFQFLDKTHVLFNKFWDFKGKLRYIFCFQGWDWNFKSCKLICIK
ncbi:hypothetical protein Lalb_Chr03g0030971 [Lupinus albus]|uniref:Uncharacterized protein n=1 Tax=Lupinus albus TaxID=3870 RepID=A0A6A4QSJ7_LUPAL|nr:hypothetical protein Lalb_Chr03g0030971 [Lupinus albus]